MTLRKQCIKMQQLIHRQSKACTLLLCLPPLGPACVCIIKCSLCPVKVKVRFHAARGVFQLSESMMKVSKFGLSSDTSASTKSSMVGRLCSIPVAQKHKAAGFGGACPMHKPLARHCDRKSAAYWNI